ncbi:unnamed protein product [Closterium sp. Naga37s-1]|nr:unnamed protein product [Closterium sp. Naga37s-1]
MILAPFLARAVHAHLYGGDDVDAWSFHMVLLALLRFAHGNLWMAVARWPYLIDRYRIQKKGINFEQVDRESHWDDAIILQALVITALREWLPGARNLPLFSWPGLALVLALHVGPVECLYYWCHRFMHTPFFYASYHCHHHASVATEPTSAHVHTFLEQIGHALLLCVPVVGTWLLGGASIGALYAYWLACDWLNAVGHCNFEFVPVWLLRAVPPLKYLVHTPTYHSLHHSEPSSNYCLFMPVYDLMAGTVNPNTDHVHKEARRGPVEHPDFVFLGHGVNLQCFFHLPFLMPYGSTHPFKPTWTTFALLILCLPAYFVLWFICPRFAVDKKRLRGLKLHIWMVPRFGINYFIPFEKRSINNFIESAILAADKQGVKVLALGALNKNESLNGGGKLFLDRHPNLKVRLVHGNTLTAAIILREIREDATEVFLTGSTSKLGRAISLYLALRGVRVLMLTPSRERFEAIRSELPEERQHLLVQVTQYSQASQCPVWIIGKGMMWWEQRHAPPGTHFHQFVVPPIAEVRPDCTYGKLAAMRLPDDVENLKFCEVSLGYAMRLPAEMCGHALVLAGTCGKLAAMRLLDDAENLDFVSCYGLVSQADLCEPCREALCTCWRGGTTVACLTITLLASSSLNPPILPVSPPSPRQLALPRGHIYACHAGGLVHLLEGWDYHEVGRIDVSRIDPTWDAAMRHGLRPMQ